MSRWHFSTNDTLRGNAVDLAAVPVPPVDWDLVFAGVVEVEFAGVCYGVDYFIFDNPAYIQRRRAVGADWDDGIEIPADTIYCTSGTTQAIRICNVTAGDVARYSIVGWY